MGEHPSQPAIITIQNSDINLTQRYITDVSPLAAEAIKHRADADVKIAQAIHSTPARQESLRIGMVVGGMVVAASFGHALGWDKDVVVAVVGGIGAIYGIPKAIEKIRGTSTKELSPPTHGSSG